MTLILCIIVCAVNSGSEVRDGDHVMNQWLCSHFIVDHPHHPSQLVTASMLITGLFNALRESEGGGGGTEESTTKRRGEE